MVKKLLKYEFASFSKSILPMEIILLCIALFTRIVQFFEDDSLTFNIFMVSSVVMLVISMIVCLVMTVVLCTVRFYKNLYTSEGYLTLTLPVTHSQHIIAKIIFSVCASLVSILSVIIAFMIATAGDVLTECFKAAGYIIKELAKFLKVNFYLYSLEAIVFIIAAITAGFLLFFACITVGQMAKKNRVLAAFGVYFGYYIFRQILGTILLIVFLAIQENRIVIFIKDWLAGNPIETAHIVFCGAILYLAVISIIYFLVTRFILKRKLNIE